MPCTQVKTSTYQTRKSPAFHAANCKGIQKKGKNGTYVSQPDKRGIYRWVKTLKQKGKYYDTLDNGASPFRVYVNGPSVSIYKRSDHADKLVQTVSVKKVYLGGKKSEIGNSIVLHLSGNKYMFIGHEIYTFQMEDAVDSYFSLVGNSDVPYPVLLGTHEVYFMLDHCHVSRNEFDSMTKAEWEDAYQHYYGFVNPEKKLEDKCKKMKGFHMVSKQT